MSDHCARPDRVSGSNANAVEVGVDGQGSPHVFDPYHTAVSGHRAREADGAGQTAANRGAHRNIQIHAVMDRREQTGEAYSER